MASRNERLGMISVPWQEYEALYAPADALRYGTVFSGLNQPYSPIPCAMPQSMQMQMQGMQKKR